MTILVAEAETPSFEELHQENIQLRRELKLLLQEMRKYNKYRGHIIELRNVLQLAPVLLARGVHIGKCPDWSEEQLALMGLTGEEFPLQHGKSKLIIQLAYARANGARVVGEWDDLVYLFVPHFSELIRYYRQQRREMQTRTA
ncbi:hypothetical protein MK805_02505 [Shimazuella sp. AN120528]|uniref:hypothetical protein n=1 Tax=Shimazuella soli TaxID=1892854 RepID=UPI001F0D3174|nr:hypothetical protein [Shimazuella soli]MCH5583838.1 hypothetical protein [Shimazuella soli]